MEETIFLGKRQIKYKLIKNRRSRRLRLSVDKNCQLIAAAPRLLPNSFIERFIREKAGWILKQIDYYENHCQRLEVRDYRVSKEEARVFIQERVDYFNRFYNFSFRAIRIKNNKRNWGSCSVKKNLNFNYRVFFLPSDLADYVIVHELCHLGELNHSRNFWDLVNKKIPDYRARRAELKKIVY